MKAGAWLYLASLGLGCAGGRGPAFPTSERFPELPREPPSFAAEQVPAPVEPGPGDGRRDSESARSEPIRLQVPLDSEAASAVVSRFFMAVLLESTRELLPLLAPSAWVISEGNRQSAQAVWRSRFAQLDYTALSGRLVAPPQTLRTYTFESGERAKRDGVPVPQSPSEVVVVARPSLSWLGKTRLFGDRLAFRLKPKADEPGYEIAEIAEDFRLP